MTTTSSRPNCGFDAGASSADRSTETRRAGVRRRASAGRRSPERARRRRFAGVRVPWSSRCAAMGGAYGAVRAIVRRRPTEQRAAADVEAGHASSTRSAASPATARTCRASPDRGPSLIGVGGAAVVLPGLAPAACRPPGRAPRRAQGSRSSTTQQTQQLAAYVQSVGGGPEIPTGDLRGDDADLAEGGELFRLNCASCHGSRQGRAAVRRQDRAVAERRDRPADLHRDAVRPGEHAGVQRQPAHRRTQKKAIIAYVQTLKASEGPGRQRHRPHRPGLRGHRHLGGRHRRDHGRDPVDRGEVMSDAVEPRDRTGTALTARRTRALDRGRDPPDDAGRGMLAGAEPDGVHIVHRRDRFPIRGTKAEKRAERGVSACFVIAGAGRRRRSSSCFVALPVPLAPARHAAELPLLHARCSARCSA